MIPRYRLLVERLALKDYNPATQRAQEIIRGVAFKLNESLQNKASALRIAEIQNSLYPTQSLFTPKRRLIREGPLMKYSATLKEHSSGRRYYFFLFSDALVLSDIASERYSNLYH